MPPKRRHLLLRALAALLLLLLLHGLLFFARRSGQAPRQPPRQPRHRGSAPTPTHILSLPISAVSSYYWESIHRGYTEAPEDDPLAPPPAPIWEPLVFVFEAVYVCSAQRLVLVARAEQHMAMDGLEVFSAVSATVLDAGGQPLAQGLNFSWDAQLGYESVALGVRALELAPGGPSVCLLGPQLAPGSAVSRPHHLALRLEYGPARRWQATHPLHIQRAPTSLGAWRAAARARPTLPEGLRLLPPPARVPYALCTTVMTPSDLIRLWVRYYALKGVGAFYIYAVAPTPPATAALMAALRRILSHMHGGAAVTLIPWAFPMFSEHSDANYAQPAALNSCATRFAAAHTGLLFYDVDEFLVTREKRSVGEWLGALQARHGGAVPSFVTSMAWALVGATPGDLNFSLPAFRALRAAPRPPPLLRSARNCSDGGDLFLCPLNCSHWAARGAGPSRARLLPAAAATVYAPIPPPPRYDDDDRGAWSVNDTAAEEHCWHVWAQAARPSPAPTPPPGYANLPKYDYTPLPRPLPTPLGLPPSRLSIGALISAPITRTRIKVGGGREKYTIPDAARVLLGEAPQVVNIHGIYGGSGGAAQVALQPEDGYHIHFLNDNRAEAQVLRIAAFLHHYWTKAKYNASRGVQPPEPRDEEEVLQLEVEFGEALASAVREGGQGGGEEEAATAA